MLNKAVLLSTLSIPDIKYFASFCIIPTSIGGVTTLGYGDSFPNSSAYNFKGITSQDIVGITFAYTSPPFGAIMMTVSDNLHQFIVNYTTTPDLLQIRIAETGKVFYLGCENSSAEGNRLYWFLSELDLGTIVEGEEITIELIPEASLIGR